jgi:diguanylate cyclase (GGDEF)-like protein
MAEPSLAGSDFQLATALASRRHLRAAATATAAAMLFFFVTIPFAARPLARLPVFISTYEVVLITCDVVTFVLIFQQYAFSKSIGLMILGLAYVYTAAMAACHILTFPKVFAETGLLGAGPQTSAWIYIAWHAGYPLMLILYARLDAAEARAGARARAMARRRAWGGGILALGIVLAIGLAMAQTAGAILLKDRLPSLVHGVRFSPLMKLSTLVVSALCAGAMVLLLRRGPITILRLWLIVSLGAWILDVSMTNAVSGARYDLGWYAGKIFGLIAAAALVVVYILENTKNYQRLIDLTERFEQLSRRDGLTGLANRRFLDDYLRLQLDLARRRGGMVALVLCDIDVFKAYNDSLGHLAGDDCLISVSAALGGCCRRPSDLAARYGGEEFALILPDTDLDGALGVAEAVRRAVIELKIAHPSSVAGPWVTISAGVGVASGTPDIAPSPVSLIAAADGALYQAKLTGRNRVIGAGAGAGTRGGFVEFGAPA